MLNECRFECRYEYVCAPEQVLEIEFCVASAFVVVVAAGCCLLSVARRLLVVGSFLFSLFGVFGKGARDFVNFELCFLWICLFAGSRSCGSWSSQQHPSREARIETATEIMQWDRDLGLGSDRRRSAALFVLASWRVLCVCCNQITNDHKKYSPSSSALRL